MGINGTVGPQVGNDISVAAGGTVYAGDTSNVRGYATEASGSIGPAGVTSGYTTAKPNQAAPDNSSVGFVGGSVGAGVAPVSGHVSKTMTGAVDVAVPMSPVAKAVSAAVAPYGPQVRGAINTVSKDVGNGIKNGIQCIGNWANNLKCQLSKCN